MTDTQPAGADANPEARAALCLLSGGLDSQLAVCVLREQGVDVRGIVFDSPFFDISAARRAAAALRVPLHVEDMTDDIVALLHDPPHGFGSCMNPCIDCHARMLRLAGQRMPELGARFLATGEVLNERPMSQNRASLTTVARDSGFADLVLRPLSARRLAPTLPEREGWVDRERLLDLEGRGRRPQLAMAAHYGLQDFPTPAGGCRLTEPNFSRRLRDLKDHEGLQDRRDLVRLRIGRHFRLGPRVKAIVGRNQTDNRELEASAAARDLVLRAEGVAGPTVLVPREATDAELQLAAALCARYSDAGPDHEVEVACRGADGFTRRIRARAIASDRSETMLV